MFVMCYSHDDEGNHRPQNPAPSHSAAPPRGANPRCSAVLITHFILYCTQHSCFVIGSVTQTTSRDSIQTFTGSQASIVYEKTTGNVRTTNGTVVIWTDPCAFIARRAPQWQLSCVLSFLPPASCILHPASHRILPTTKSIVNFYFQLKVLHLTSSSRIFLFLDTKRVVPPNPL